MLGHRSPSLSRTHPGDCHRWHRPPGWQRRSPDPLADGRRGAGSQCPMPHPRPLRPRWRLAPRPGPPWPPRLHPNPTLGHLRPAARVHERPSHHRWPPESPRCPRARNPTGRGPPNASGPWVRSDQVALGSRLAHRQPTPGRASRHPPRPALLRARGASERRAVQCRWRHVVWPGAPASEPSDRDPASVLLRSLHRQLVRWRVSGSALGS